MNILVAIVTGVGVLLAGNLPWGVLAGLNFRLWTAIPWAIVPMAIYLWAYWRFIGGTWGPADSAPTRRARLRANGLAAPLWAAAIGAGLVGFASLVALLSFAARVIHLPASEGIPMPAGMPAATAFLLLAMQSIVAGVTEESAFRGYMQSMIEKRHGLLGAILVNGLMFGLLHFPNHPNDVLLMIPYYVAVSAVYGGLTWAANSILPALMLHSAADIVILTRWWRSGISEWQMTATPPPFVWDRGVDTGFIVTAVAVVVLALLTALAYRALHHARLRQRPDGVLAG